MPSKTNQDRILDLDWGVASLTERVDNLRRDIDRIEKSQEERTNRRWSLMLAVVGVIGGLVGAILPELFKVRARVLPVIGHPPTTTKAGKFVAGRVFEVRVGRRPPRFELRDQLMTAAVKAFLDAFDSLSEPDRHEVAAEILRRTVTLDLSPLDDEALTQIALTTFLELDAREAADEPKRFDPQ